jgi:threonine/homoserine/homoserine lactone efflux protein
MLLASGVVFGFNRTLPHLLGGAVRFALMLVVCASGSGALLVGLPSAALCLKVFGSAYQLYLAWTRGPTDLPQRARHTLAARRRGAR